MPTSPPRVSQPGMTSAPHGSISGTPVRSPQYKKPRITTPGSKKTVRVQDPNTQSTTLGTTTSRSNSFKGPVKVESGVDSW